MTQSGNYEYITILNVNFFKYRNDSGNVKFSSYILKIHTYLWKKMIQCWDLLHLVSVSKGYRGNQTGYELVIVKLNDGYMGAHYAIACTFVHSKIFPLKKKMEYSLLEGFALHILEGGQGSPPLLLFLWNEVCMEVAEVGWSCCIPHTRSRSFNESELRGAWLA